jgi:hypothetical protein
MGKNQDFKKFDIIYSGEAYPIHPVEVKVDGPRLIIHGENLPPFNRNSDIKIIGYLENGIVEMEGNVSLSIKEQININIWSKGTTSDRRDSLKVKTDALATIKRAYMANRKKKTFYINEGVQLRDISAGGLCFYSDRVYFKRQRLYISLDEIQEGLMVKAVVLRKVREKYSIGFKYHYGCQFEGLESPCERIIREYTFKMQIVSHQKEQEKDKNIYD